MRCPVFHPVRIVMLALALAPAAWGQNHPPVHLAFGMKPGQTARYGYQEVEILTNKAEVLRGGEVTNQYQTEAQILVRAMEREGESLIVELTYERVRFRMDSPVVKEPPVFDTGSPLEEKLENPLAPALMAVIDKPIRLRIAASGLIESVTPPDVDIPDVRYHGIADQMLTAEWITPRFQCIFSLVAPNADAAVSLWSISSVEPIAHSVQQRLHIETMHTIDAAANGVVAVSLNSKAEILPYEGEGAMNPRDFVFKGSGAATWNAAEGLLGSRNVRHEWSFNALPQPTLPTFVSTSLHTVVQRLK